MEFQACDPWTVSPSFASRSESFGRLRSMVLAMWWGRSLEPQAVGVAVVVVALVQVAVAGGHTGLAEDDHAGGAAVDAQRAPRAHVLVDDEDHVVVGIEAGLDRVGRLGHRLRRQHVDAL